MSRELLSRCNHQLCALKVAGRRRAASHSGAGGGCFGAARARLDWGDSSPEDRCRRRVRSMAGHGPPTGRTQSTRLDPNQPNPAAQDQPRPTAQDQPRPAAQDQPRPTAQDQPRPTPQDQPRPAAQDQPRPAAQDQPRPTAQDQPRPTPQDQPRPAAQDQPRPAAQDQPRPAAQDQPRPAAQDQPRPTPQDQPRPAAHGSARTNPDSSHTGQAGPTDRPHTSQLRLGPSGFRVQTKWDETRFQTFPSEFKNSMNSDQFRLDETRQSNLSRAAKYTHSGHRTEDRRQHKATQATTNTRPRHQYKPTQATMTSIQTYSGHRAE